MFDLDPCAFNTRISLLPSFLEYSRIAESGGGEQKWIPRAHHRVQHKQETKNQREREREKLKTEREWIEESIETEGGKRARGPSVCKILRYSATAHLAF